MKQHRITNYINYLAFAALMGATVMGWQSLWGLLFLYWTIRSFYSGRTVLLSDITRNEDSVLFWLIQIAWVVFGVLLILADFLPGRDY